LILTFKFLSATVIYKTNSLAPILIPSTLWIPSQHDLIARVPIDYLRCRTVDRVFFSEKQRRFESIRPSWGFLTTRQRWVANSHSSTLTRILQNGNRSRATREHSTHFTVSFVPDGFTGVCYTILSPSLHSQYAVIIPHSGLAQVLGLPEYVASTASHDHKQAVQRTVLSRHRRGHYVQPQTGCKPRFHLV
jgi:hypothetical protein